jgi:prepilin-type processing-associated H-X9-DG protein
VVIAIIGVLIALLLPAVQAAREAARRTQCRNNLKQLALGAHNHHDTYNRFPPGLAADQPPFGTRAVGYGSTWLVYILPFIEQKPLFDKMLFTGGSGWHNAEPAGLNNALQVQNLLIPSFRCPSSPLPEFTGVQPGASQPVQMPNYVGIAGATATAFAGTGYNPGAECIGAGGSGCCHGGQQCNNGVLFHNSKIKFGDISDGSSNVMMMSEHSDFIFLTNGTKNPWTASGPHGWTIGASTTSTTPNGDRAFNVTSIVYRINLKTGWASDNCSLGVCSNTGANIPLNSTHPGGVNAAFADGSVQFVSDTTALGVLARFATRSDGQVVSLN